MQNESEIKIELQTDNDILHGVLIACACVIVAADDLIHHIHECNSFFNPVN